MANPEHLAILKQGVEVSNKWKGSTDVFPDLQEADLAKLDLYNFDFQWADLGRANLSRSNLGGANLTWANVSEADLEETHFGGTILGGANFSSARNLESCEHGGPSIIDNWTVQNSWPLPRNFLRGCGMPDSLIDYYSSLFKRSVHLYSCFISHSTQDDGFAHRLHDDLQNESVRCWFAPEDLKIGDPFRQRIDESIRLHEKLLLIFSEHSVQSPWVQDEVESALERERREDRLILFPIRIDDAVMHTDIAWAASIRRTRHIGDFSNWKDHDSYQAALQRLLRDLKADDRSASKAEA